MVTVAGMVKPMANLVARKTLRMSEQFRLNV